MSFPDILSSDLFRAFERLELGESLALPSPLMPVATDAPRPTAPRSPSAAQLGVWSSGSTGQPKLIWRRWSELLDEITIDSRYEGWTWATSFSPESFAGVQVALQAWRTRGNLLWLGNDWDGTWAKVRENQPQALCCTPTFLDLLLQFETPMAGGWSPRQITLGGEILRSRSGQRFAARFPETRFTVVYATAEHGVILKTHRLDGWYEAAAPVVQPKTSNLRCEPSRSSGEDQVCPEEEESLQIGWSNAELPQPWRVTGDTLEVNRHGRWISTGDRAEINGGLIRIMGRADAVANIGGVKVSLDEINRLAEEVPGVRRASAFIESSAVVGQIVGLRFALEPGCVQDEVQPRLETHLRRELRKEAWPRSWEVDEVGMGRNSKRS